MPDSRSQSIRNIGLLSAVQALGGSSSSIILSVAALAAVNFAPDRSAVTLPVTAMIVGLALTTSTATMVIYRLGRTRGLMRGAAIGIPASIVATLAVVLGQFYLFASFDKCCAGTASTYRIMVGRADTITGPYRDRNGTLMLEGGGTELLASDGRVRGPGGQEVFLRDGAPWLAYHWYDRDQGGLPKLALTPLGFDEEGWPAIAPPQL